MAENKFMQFIPPQLRGPATDVGIFGRVATDNVLGFIDNYLFDGKARRFDDDFESTGETLGTALREEPIETGKALALGSTRVRRVFMMILKVLMILLRRGLVRLLTG